MTRTVAHLVADVLADLGVGHIFGVVGSGNFDVTNALIARGIPYTAARHEGGAASMADGFARLAALPAIVSVHQGCGLTNAMTGIGEAAKSRTPVIVLAADVAASSRLSNFRIDQDALARSVGAVSERVHSAATAIADVTRAWQTAVHDRRTVVLNLPLDVQSAPAPEHAGTVAPPSAPEPVRPAHSAVEQFAALIAGASRPVFVTGRGGRTAGPEISALAEHAGALVATSAVANGLFRGEEFDLGISGGFSAPLTAQLISDADLVVGWGCALNMWTMRHGSLIGPDARVVQIDDTASALGAHRPIDLGIHGDCATTAIDVLTELTRNTKARHGYRTPEVSTELSARLWWNDTETPDLSTSETIDPRPFSKALDDILPAERVVAIDSGNFMGYPSTYLRVPDHMGFCFTQAFQSIGLGLSSGIGAALAQPDRLAVIGTGDGGFMMGISELETAVRLGRPLLIAVYNDAAYGAEVHHFEHLPHDGDAVNLSTVTFPDIDIAAIAEGFGARGVTVRTLADMDEVRRWASAPNGVMVIDAKIAADGGAWWLAEAFKGH